MVVAKECFSLTSVSHKANIQCLLWIKCNRWKDNLFQCNIITRQFKWWNIYFLWWHAYRDSINIKITRAPFLYNIMYKVFKRIIRQWDEITEGSAIDTCPLLYRPMSMEMNTYTLQIWAFSLVNLSRAET